MTLKLSPTSSGVVFGTLPSLRRWGGLHDVPARRRRGLPGLEREPRRRSVRHRDHRRRSPVAVFSGNMTTTYGRTADNLHSPDMAHEQMPPVFAWSHNVRGRGIAAASRALATRCWASRGASVWRLVVGERPTLTGRHRRSVGTDSYRPARARGGDATDRGPGTSSSPSKEPLLMTQGIDCEPSLSLAISADKSARRPDVRGAALLRSGGGRCSQGEERRDARRCRDPRFDVHAGGRRFRGGARPAARSALRACRSARTGCRGSSG